MESDKKRFFRRNSDQSGRPRISPGQSRATKLVIFFAITVLLLGALVIRLIYIVKVHGTDYQKAVLQNQAYDSVVLPFKRGDIVDRSGTVLATSEKVYNMVIDASVMLTYEDDRYFEPTLRALGECFPADLIDVSQIRYYVTNNENSKYYVVAKRLSYSDIQPFLAVQEENDFVRGVYFEDEYKRVYPNKNLASTVLGFTRKNSNAEGQYGLEEYYDDILTGTNGREYGYQNDDDTLERTVKPAIDGYTIHTTIDANIQKIVEKYLKDFNDTHMNAVRTGNGAENLGCIIMDVNSGEILAMANYPDYDPNDYKNITPLIGTQLIEAYTNPAGYIEYETTDTPITQELIYSLSEDQLNVNFSALWKNYCISNTYEPGSTAKPFTVAAALESGAITGNEVYTCNGYLEVGGHKIKCHTYASGGDGAVSVQDSIAWSCNVALMKIGQAMGKDSFSRFQKVFNFGLKTNIDLAGESRTASLVYDAKDMLPSDLATNTFGQNFNATMIQMITGFSALINGGYYYEPHMVSKITNAGGATIENIEPRILKQVISESTSEKLRQYTRATVMEEGGERRTGKTARPAGYAIGGKTGTAETLPRGNKEYVVSFMGYAPADDPQIAIYVVVDRPNAAKQDDAKFATGIVRNILTEALPYLGIYMTEELSEKEIKELEEKQLENTYRFGDNSGNSESAGEDKKEEYVTEGTIVDPTGEAANIYPKWMTYPIDPATGYRVNPDNGEKYDASTGELVEDVNESMGLEVPVNGNLGTAQREDTTGR
ncbi:MAG: cell division protein FtsI [Lachnospiraceae bacterium]|nr:cell division protein FtsI [Lachnospiraceae bacterium]